MDVMQARLEDFPAYRHADVRLHVGLAETTGSLALVSAMTEAQGAVGALIDHIPHPPEVLASSNLQHRQLLAAVRVGDVERAARIDHGAPRGDESTFWLDSCCPRRRYN